MTVSLKGLTLQYTNRSEENQQADWSIPSDWVGVHGGVASTANGPLAWGRGEEFEIVRNRTSWAAKCIFSCDHAVSLDQIHEASILRVGAEHRGAGFVNPLTRIPRADGMLTTDPGTVLVTSHADCAPIFLFSGEHRAISLVHAGWRGTMQGIAGHAAKMLEHEVAAHPRELKVAVGPMIDTCHYPVGEDVAEQFAYRFGPQVVVFFSGRPHLDLYAAIVIDLLRAGVAECNLSARPPSTYTDSRWSSFRRDGTAAGGMLAFFTLN